MRSLTRKPLRTLGMRARRRIDRATAAWRERRQDRAGSTYCSAVPSGGLEPQCVRPVLAVSDGLAGEVARSAEDVLRHRFDLLGSGGVIVEYGLSAAGVEGHRYDAGQPVVTDPEGLWLCDRLHPPNVPQARRIWQLVDAGYRPIDWQLDFKSGYRWSERDWYLDVPHGHQPGADIKVPWELARMQHLPLLGLACALAGAAGTTPFRTPDTYRREFRNQVLDFAATNPPRFGANWRTPLEVAIRVVNWLVAYDLFAAAGGRFDGEFEAVFATRVREHASHLVEHLEWSPAGGNHYLGDVVGLLFAASYLPPSTETDDWLAFAVQELVSAADRQFDADGANFEGSTSYHRLSAEMVAWGAARLMGLPAQRIQGLAGAPLATRVPGTRPLAAPLDHDSLLPSRFAAKLVGMARFTASLLRPGGGVPQIGDNDSARFLSLQPGPDRSRHSHLPALIGALTERGREPDAGEIDAQLARALATNRTLLLAAPPPGTRPCTLPQERNGPERRTSRSGWTPSPRGNAAPDWIAFEAFGLYLLVTDRLCLSFRCGGGAPPAPTGHAHDDQLSIDLTCDGAPVIVDPGSYLYTALPARRRAFRSAAMHNTLVVAGKSQHEWFPGGRGLFEARQYRPGRVVSRAAGTICGEHQGYGAPCRRSLTVSASGVEGLDECGVPGSKTVLFHLAPGVTVADSGPAGVALEWGGPTSVRLEPGPGLSVTVADSLYSPAYGTVVPNRLIAISSAADRLRWRLVLSGETPRRRGSTT